MIRFHKKSMFEIFKEYDNSNENMSILYFYTDINTSFQFFMRLQKIHFTENITNYKKTPSLKF